MHPIFFQNSKIINFEKINMFIMKKLGLLWLAVAMMTLFVSCDKDDLGVFNPKLKIARVYSEVDMHYLQEQWSWSTDYLEKIDYYKKNGNVDYTQTYHYDKNRLTSIEMDKMHTNFVYDGKTLTNIYTYYGDQLMESYALSYDKKKLSHLSVQKSLDKSFARPASDFLACLFPMEDPAPAACLYSNDDSKGTYDYSAAEIDFIWEADNIKYMKMTINRPEGTQKLTYTYLYDNNINPKKNFFTLYVDNGMLDQYPQSPFCSSNNVTSVYVTDETDFQTRTHSYSYSYNYYKKYPTKMHLLKYNDMSQTTDSLLLYTFQYQ